MTYTIGKVAHMAHVSVRTLHYYDTIGLLNPSYETASGYRLYADSDLELLQQTEDIGVYEGRLETHPAGRPRDQRRPGGSDGPQSV